MSVARFRSRTSFVASLLVPLALIAITVLVGANGTPSLQGTVTLIFCNLIVVIGLQGGRSGEINLGAMLAKRCALIATTLRARPTATLRP